MLRPFLMPLPDLMPLSVAAAVLAGALFAVPPAHALPGDCATGFSGGPARIQDYFYSCRRTMRVRCWPGYTPTPPRSSALTKRIYQVVYRCTQTPGSAPKGPRPRFPRYCDSGFKRTALRGRGAYLCRMGVGLRCRNLFWPTGVSVRRPRQGPRYPTYVLDYRCNKSPD